MTREEFFGILAELLERPMGSFSEENTLESLDWDSLKVIEFMSVADEKLECEVRPDAINKCNTVKDLIALVSNKLE